MASSAKGEEPVIEGVQSEDSLDFLIISLFLIGLAAFLSLIVSFLSVSFFESKVYAAFGSIFTIAVLIFILSCFLRFVGKEYIRMGFDEMNKTIEEGRIIGDKNYPPATELTDIIFICGILTYSSLKAFNIIFTGSYTLVFIGIVFPFSVFVLSYVNAKTVSGVVLKDGVLYGVFYNVIIYRIDMDLIKNIRVTWKGLIIDYRMEDDRHRKSFNLRTVVDPSKKEEVKSKLKTDILINKL